MPKSPIPKIIYGTAWKGAATTSLVVSAVLQGFRAIDTACQPKHYREDLVGEALKILQDEHGIKREDLWIQTKFTSLDGQDRNKPLPYDPTKELREQILESFSTSTKNLRTSYLDSYILHSPEDTDEDTMEAWKVLIDLQNAGSVRMIGISNTYDVSTVKMLAKEHKVEVVQNRWYERNDWNKDVVRYCKANGGMYQSFWTLTGSPNLLADKRVVALATQHSCTPEQIVYRVAQINGVTPLAGSKNDQHVRDGVETEKIDLGDELSHDNLKSLEKLIFT